MGVKYTSKELNSFVGSFLEDDFNYLDSPDQAVVSTNHVLEDSNEHFTALTTDDFAHLVPGCFVQVGIGEASYWVEIGKIEGEMISGMVHPELSSVLCLVDHDSCQVARFNRNQITALGCDRYCWC